MSNKLAAGIDVSHYKNRIDWKRVKEAGVSYAFIKATEADDFVDSRFDYNWSRTRREGIIRGAYHFFRPRVDPVRQANHFLKIVGPILHRTDLPPVLDVEVYPEFVETEYKRISVQERIQRIQVWLQTVEKATGKVPVIYTDYYTWRDFIGDTERFVRNPLWIAAYRVEKPRVPANNWGGRGWAFWQTTNRGVVPGIRGEAACVDLDLFRGTLDDMHTWLKISEPRPLPPDVTNGDMMAALVDAAEQMGVSSNEWVTRTGLSYLVDPVGNSLRPYDGPAVTELPLDDDEKKTLQDVLVQYEGWNASSWSITHQDVINAFYYASSLENIGGWTLVERAGLGYMGKDRDRVYDGPVIAQLPGLTLKQKEAISAYLGISYPTQAEEEPVEVSEVEDIEQDSADTDQENSAEEAVVAEPEQQTETEIGATEEDAPVGAECEDAQATYSVEMDNQAVINAFYLAAIKLDINGLELVSSAGLQDLSEKRSECYTGPKIEDLPALTNEQKIVIAELLEVELPEEIEVVDDLQQGSSVEEEVEPVVEGGERLEAEQEEVFEPTQEAPTEPQEQPEPEVPAVEEQESPTYLGLVNQDIIDLFYKVAAFFNENGWDWIARVGLGHLGDNRQVRYKMYKGPDIERISGLSEEQKERLLEMFNQYRQ